MNVVELRLPADVEAEAIVTGCAIDSPQAARYATHLVPADFTVAEHRRLWRAALACQLPFRCDGSRTWAIANAARVGFELAEELRTSAPVLHDREGNWARRVQDATLRRRLLAEVAELHDALGSGKGLDEAQARLERVQAVAAGETVGVLVGPEGLAR